MARGGISSLTSVSPELFSASLNNEIKKLSLETSRVQNGLLKKVKEDFIDKASKMNLRDRNTLGLAMRGEMQLPKSFDPVMKKAWEEFQLDIGAIGLKQGQLFDQWEKEGMINSYDKLFSEKQFLKDPKGYSKKFYRLGQLIHSG